jgi:hypothetical protein
MAGRSIRPAFTPQTLLWLRALNSFISQVLPGTDGASFPFWSPDRRFIGFFAGAKPKKVDVSGGASQVIADAPAAGVGHGIATR